MLTVRHWPASLLLAVVLCAPFLFSPVRAQGLVSLADPARENLGWTFGNGPEFPGAAGGLTVEPAAKRDGRDSLRLEGDFAKGGNYVQAGTKIPGVDPRELSLWVRSPDTDHLTVRLNDGTGQTHQLVLMLERQPGWQHVVFPLERFFATRGQADAVTTVGKYESWGGAKDGKWHGPATAIYLLAGRLPDRKTHTLWFNDVALLPRPAASAAPRISTTVRLDEFSEEEQDWRLDLVGGARGALAVVKDEPAPGRSSLKLSGDLAGTGGGAYAAAIRGFQELDLRDLTAVRMKVKSPNVTRISVQLKDGTGQTHQKKGIPVTPDGQWHELVLRTAEIAGGEHWAGANDGQWHGEPAQLVLILGGEADPKEKQPVLFMTDITADAVQAAVARAASFRSDFEEEKLPAGWVTAGAVSVDAKTAFKGGRSLLLSRSLAEINRPVSAAGPAFEVTPGQWQVALATRSDLQSPDSSYSGTVLLDCLDAAGKVLRSVPLAEVYGRHTWQPVSRTVELPPGARTARFQVQVNKASGQFWVDDLSAAYLAPAPRRDNRVERVLFSTAQLGNLLYPEDPRTVEVTVRALKPLKPAQLAVSWEVRDYWGAEQTKPRTVTLAAKEKQGDRFLYGGTIDLKDAPLEIGRYYEVHAAVPREGDEPFRAYTTLAILPKAVTKQYRPEEIPFTSRSWDNRVPETVRLSDRLGIRIAGIWGGWSEKPPYRPEAPTLNVARELGMGWLTGTPAAGIERGETKYDEQALREGVANLIREYGATRPMYLDLGNEPHGTGAQVLKNVAAYRTLYEAIKKADPSITVIATAVEPNEEYFKAGYGKYCDVYDFHIYEGAEDVRRTIAAYRELMKKYDVVHPIWSTELGLNSQGLSRTTIASDLYRKFVTFFAAGGANVSWFDLLYPDPEGTRPGTSGEAMDVFYSRYNRYSPKLDALAYYNAVNAICIKKFAAEATYPDGVHAFLFRDREGRSLQVLWKDDGRADVSVPLPGVGAVQAVRIDGSRRGLNAAGKAVTVAVMEDPLLLLYDGGPMTLPAAPNAPALSLEAPPAMVVRGASTSVTVALNGAGAGEVNLEAPPFWTVTKAAARTGEGKPAVRFSVSAPADTAARMADLCVTLGTGERRQAELYWRPSVSGQLGLSLLPRPAAKDRPPAVEVTIRNNGAAPQEVSWDLSLAAEQALAAGEFGPPAPAAAHFTEAPAGSLTLAGGQTRQLVLPLAEVDPLKLYRVRASVTDTSGRRLVSERLVGGFVRVPRMKSPPKLDGVLDEAAWAEAPAQRLDTAAQVFKVSPEAAPWKGPADLSATAQFLWDDRCLYLGVKVTDDVAGGLLQDDRIWAQDGLQLLIDPARASTEKPGKYDLGAALGKKGPQAWRFLSADPRVPAGAAPEIRVAVKRRDGTGAITYEVAIPWKSLAPFQPRPGADLGLTLGLNEDDGGGRKSFMTWFGNVHTKQSETVGDLVLAE